ncbi:hypothetical protein [Cohnella sp. LGH]|uniref:hypothetical protein n=1 Tax=Cohnella sp. LGH TaxID=1619153 RepID=UPI0035302195
MNEDIFSMKAITVWQPWATLIALRLKRYETRSWSTKLIFQRMILRSIKLDMD